MTQHEVKRLFSYNEDTGLFVRKSSGKITGSLSSKGYIVVKVDGKKHYAHRLAWLYMYGYMPEYIDHRNRIRSDNALVNLRPTTILENSRNRGLNTNNKSGVTGVYSSGKKYSSSIKVNGKSIYLGVFPTFDDAVSARKHAELIYKFE